MFIDDVIVGSIIPIGEKGADIARTTALEAGYAESVAGVQLNQFCSSGLEAIDMAGAYVRLGGITTILERMG